MLSMIANVIGLLA